MNSIEYARVDVAGLTPGCVLIEDDHTVYFVIGLADNHIDVMMLWSKGIGLPVMSIRRFPAQKVFSYSCKIIYDPSEK